MRHILAVWLLAALAPACGGKQADACGDCPSGMVCDGGTCRRVCARAGDCGECEGCISGVCRELDNCDPCDECRSDQVCYRGSCMPACDPVDGSCQPGFSCVESDGVELCAPNNGIQVQGPKWDLGAQQSQSPSGTYTVRGRLVPYGGRVSGGSYVVTDVKP